MPLPPGLRGIVLDIEGTTTPIAFVHEVLFPFARARLAEALGRADTDPEIAAAQSRLRAEWQAETSAPEADFGDGSSYALRAMAADRKSTGLKQLQGLIWQRGYASGELVAPLFADVPRALEAWRAAGLALAIFSSGSVLAQRLLFGHSEYGDLRALFAGWFDTTTGAKREPAAYRAIAAALEQPAGLLLFLSDVPEELDAARGAGMQTGLLRRPGNPPVEAGGHSSFESFEALLPG